MTPGRPETIADGIVRVLAPNPSPMTGPGTNSYLLGDRDLAVIDPGPAMATHLEALLAAIGGRPVRAVLVTHAHRDHTDLASPLARRTGAPILAFGDVRAGRSTAMEALAGTGGLGGGEGVAEGFRPDITLADGESLDGADWSLRAFHTPGHFGNHLCFVSGDAGFSGDLVLGWTTTLISPPDGDIGDFRTSCIRLRNMGLARLLPGHGPAVDVPADRIDTLLAHRLAREKAILAALSESDLSDIASLTMQVYADTPPEMHPAAARNLLAHLVDLCDRGLAEAVPRLALDARYRLARCSKET
ncbi:MBL fold metallo-hydrolase [Histidinibacterium lentulum]|uniref:MBL fold metallo-hydrolase n=1 Tax=Histidinibacterium lentulum TaxID=2480588 RepID=A0A3N2QY29_9RHOB|nr:MBL fold metallo-hydrolase [Histidinibacterium lentulum]ROU00122.1 MBL fold metallo-hydrolase [Histidinibacterium lentulum]